MTHTTAAQDRQRAEVIARLRAAGCVFAEDEAALMLAQTRDPAELATLLARRESGLPLEHVLGWAEFAGRRMTVTPGVFVPRPRTELLVEQAIALARSGQVLVDLCCGCGALAAVLAPVVAPGPVHAVDIDAAAVACARINLADAGGQVFCGDLFDPLPAELRGRIDLLLANTPYLPSAAIATLPREARDYEPGIALDGGPDGLDVQRRIAAQALDWLAPGGHLFVEVSEGQANSSAAIMRAAGLRPQIVRDADRDATVVIGSVLPA